MRARACDAEGGPRQLTSPVTHRPRMSASAAPGAVAPPSPSAAASAALVAQLVSQVQASFTQPLSSATLMTLVTTAMVAAETTSLSGQAKKTAVMSVVSTMITNSTLSAADKLTLQNAATLLLPSVIDSVVSASQGVLAINTSTLCSCL